MRTLLKTGCIALCAIVMLAACDLAQKNGMDDAASSAAGISAQDNPITERYWKLVELYGKPIGKTMRDAHFILKAHEPRVQGAGGCNTMFGSYRLGSDNRISFGNMASTRMACADGMDVEHTFLTGLDAVHHYDVQGDVLYLKAKDNSVIGRFEAVYLQ